MFSTSVFADGSDDGFLYPPSTAPKDIPHHKVEIPVVPKKKIDLNDFKGENCQETPAPVPEPEVLGLLGVGLAAFIMMRRKQK